MSVLTKENEILLKNFKIDLSNIYFYVIKRLNRYKKCSIRLPMYDNDKKLWVAKYILFIQECAKNTYLDNRKCEKMCGFKDNALGDNKYNTVGILLDIETNHVLYYYVFASRNEIFTKYINLMQEALELRKQKYGIDYTV